MVDKTSCGGHVRKGDWGSRGGYSPRAAAHILFELVMGRVVTGVMERFSVREWDLAHLWRGVPCAPGRGHPCGNEKGVFVFNKGELFLKTGRGQPCGYKEGLRVFALVKGIFVSKNGSRHSCWWKEGVWLR